MMKKMLFIAIAIVLLTGCGSQENSKQTTTNEILTETKETVVETKKETTSVEVTKKIQKSYVTKTGKELYKKCSGCHGSDGKKKALNVSKDINSMGTVKVIDALLGYKNGTYGGKMKGVMVGQMKDLSKNDIHKIAEYITAK